MNNYTDEDIHKLENAGYSYLIYGFEIGENGTPHLQGYIHFVHEKTLNKMKKIQPRAHFERRRGTIQEAVDYCKKDGDFHEFGHVRGNNGETAKAARWKEITNLAEQGLLDQLKDQYPREYFLHYSTIMKLRSHKQGVLDGPLEHEWWVGPTGTGKSKKVWEDFPEHYQKQANKWWDDYNNQDIVVIEEWEPKNECTASKLKVWCDRYPFPAEIKGGILQGLRPKKIIVTSNYTIRDCFPNPNDYEPLERRFKVVQFGEPSHQPAFAPGFNIPPEAFNDILQPIDLDTLLQEDP